MSDAADALLKTQVSNEQHAFLDALMSSAEFSIAEAERACSLEPGTGARWLKIEKVRKTLGEMLRDRRERNADVRQNVVIMLWTMACADPRGAWRKGEQLAPWELPDELAAILEGVKPIVGRDGVVVAYEYKFTRRVSILDLLLKHFDGPKLEAQNGNKATVIFRGVQGTVVEEPEG